jgi:hypothetical protein
VAGKLLCIPHRPNEHIPAPPRATNETGTDSLARRQDDKRVSTSPPRPPSTPSSSRTIAQAIPRLGHSRQSSACPFDADKTNSIREDFILNFDNSLSERRQYLSTNLRPHLAATCPHRTFDLAYPGSGTAANLRDFPRFKAVRAYRTHRRTPIISLPDIRSHISPYPKLNTTGSTRWRGSSGRCMTGCCGRSGEFDDPYKLSTAALSIVTRLSRRAAKLCLVASDRG